eukprot:2811495-Pleurochrysis_carterae.AAC.1
MMYHPTQKSVACEESTLRVRERCVKVRDPWRAQLAEEKTAGFLPPLLVLLFLALGGENSPVCSPRGATGKQARGWSRKREGRGSVRGLRAPLRGVWETPVRCTATAVTLRVAARQRGACFEA